MRTESFTIDYPKSPSERKRWNKLYGLNAIYAGKHWSQRNEDKQFWRLVVLAAMNRAGIPQKPFDKPVKISFAWNDALDIDNHAYMGKMIVDSLIGRLISNDSRKYVRAVEHRFHDGDYILVRVIDE